MIAIERFALAYKKIAFVLVISLLVMYMGVVLLPAYWSGIYRLSSQEIQNTSINVPVYTQSGSVNDSTFSLLPIFMALGVWYFIPGITAILFVLSIITKKMFSKKELGVWLLAAILIGVFIYATFPAADALLSYIVD